MSKNKKTRKLLQVVEMEIPIFSIFVSKACFHHVGYDWRTFHGLQPFTNLSRVSFDLTDVIVLTSSESSAVRQQLAALA